MKENFLFGIIGILVGLTLGFVLANTINQNAVQVSPTAMNQNANLPAGHPEIPASALANMQSAPSAQEIETAVENAKQNPKDVEAQLNAATIYYDSDRYDEAIEYLKRANQIKPDDYQIIVNLGNTYFDTNHFEDAEKWYTTALAKQPDDVNVRTDLGLTFIFRQPPNYDRAIQEFQRSLEKDPNHVQTLQNLTVAYTKKGDAANAKATLAKLETVDSSNKAIPKLREEIGKL